MLSIVELKTIARARIKDASALFDKRRYDGAVYICGYSIEIGLKARICKTLKWSDFPSTDSEFKNYKSFKTHDLKVLLSLSGVEAKIKTEFLSEWSYIQSWRPEDRYNKIGTATKIATKSMIDSAKKILKTL